MTSSAAPSEINALWRSLIRIFPALTLPLDFFFSPSMWRLMGSDLMPSLLKNGRTRLVATLLAKATTEMVSDVRDIARINAERTGEVFRLVAVGYISLPIAFAAFLSDAAPDFVRDVAAHNINNVVFGIVVLAASPIVYFCSMWRAKQLLWAIDAYRVGAVEPVADRGAKAK
jgi:hypothetical protein